MKKSRKKYLTKGEEGGILCKLTSRESGAKKDFKKSKKVLDKTRTARYNKQAVTEKGTAMYLEN